MDTKQLQRILGYNYTAFALSKINEQYLFFTHGLSAFRSKVIGFFISIRAYTLLFYFIKNFCQYIIGFSYVFLRLSEFFISFPSTICTGFRHNLPCLDFIFLYIPFCMEIYPVYAVFYFSSEWSFKSDFILVCVYLLHHAALQGTLSPRCFSAKRPSQNIEKVFAYSLFVPKPYELLFLLRSHTGSRSTGNPYPGNWQ